MVAANSGWGISFSSVVAALGLKLEPGKATLQQLIVDHTEKSPTEN